MRPAALRAATAEAAARATTKLTAHHNCYSGEGFNGATALNAVETLRVKMIPPNTPCFNGAAPLTPWKRLGSPEAGRGDEASMGPRL